MRVRNTPKRSRCGAAVAELALVLPIFIMLVMGQIESARLGMVAQLLTNAARDACRVAAIQGSTAANVESQISGDLAGAGLSMPPVSYTVTSGFDTASFGTPITVKISVNYRDVSWLPSPYFLKTAVVTGTATMIKEG
jgi:Flp pilus assembly protein TadG